jgi:hypothetical protein
MGKADAMNDWQEPENGPGRPEPQGKDPVLVFLTFVVFIALLTLLLMVFL